ncbi:MarR family winged helix-turn-helix transcriptional regulator [Amnibacterium sp.]|uniref:MarR family winged helix-turn-helix transcriptional regulator n=1 Tax=Amnibacterium sp. TaxID=1872496 RepID=UPI003F7B36B3
MPDTEDPLALDRQVCFALAATSRSVIGVYRPILEPLGLTHPQYLVLLALWERSPRTARDIADTLYLEPPTLSPLLKRLEAIGYVSRERNPDNERELRIGLTERGRALRARAEEVPGRVVERLGVPLSVLEEARDRLSELLAATRRVTDRAG